MVSERMKERELLQFTKEFQILSFLKEFEILIFKLTKISD